MVSDGLIVCSRLPFSVGEAAVKQRQILDGKYVVLGPLGEGATGQLFEAENLLLGKRVAIKAIRPELVRTEAAHERVRRMLRDAASLEHPNICGPLDLGEADGTPYIVTEMLSGESLRSEIDGPSQLSIPAACDFVLQVLAALDYAHANGVIHGALHPGNVIVVYPRPGVPWVKVTDFGLFQALEPTGTDSAEDHLAPEKEITPASDVYAAATLLFALLHGAPPRRDCEPPKGASIPAPLRLVLSAALEPDPQRRTASAQALASQLAPYTLELPGGSEFRLSLPAPSIRWIQGSIPSPSQRLSLRMPDTDASPAQDSTSSPEAKVASAYEHSLVTESLLRNPRFPSDRISPWGKRWRQLKTNLVSHPNMGAAWLFALASLGAGIACALLAAWL
jgi:serine/threonine protein kinase